MHQTTVRFGPDLWEALEAECSRLGVSAAQYVREAALARLAFTAGRSAAPEYEAALAVATAEQRPSLGSALEPPPTAPAPGYAPAAPAPFGRGGAMRARATASVERSVDQRSSADALEAESTLILRRAEAIRARARDLRAHTRQEGRR